jgi:hypothetical protein
MNSKAVNRAVRFILLLLLLLVISVMVLFIMLPQMQPAKNVRINVTPDVLARGDYLFNNVLGCPVCHSERDWSRVGAPPMPPIGAGRECFEEGAHPVGLGGSSGFPGRICFRNITPDAATGIGAWTDGEIMRAVREGIGRDDNALFPIMPYFIYNELSDSDTKAVVAYLRTLTSVERPLPATKINFPVNLFIRFLPQPVREEIPQPVESDTVEYGEYLTRLARCEFCHSPRNNRTRMPTKGREFTGGVEFQGRQGTFLSTNLTRHDSGLANMSRAEFISLFRGREGPVSGDVDIMPWTYFGGMTDQDLGAIYDYLQSLPSRGSEDASTS